MVGLSRQYTGLQKRWFPALQWDLLMMGSSYTQLRLKAGGFLGVAFPFLGPFFGTFSTSKPYT